MTKAELAERLAAAFTRGGWDEVAERAIGHLNDVLARGDQIGIEGRDEQLVPWRPICRARGSK